MNSLKSHAHLLQIRNSGQILGQLCDLIDYNLRYINNI